MFCGLLEGGADDNIGINVDFFECGGDSLRAGQLVSQMRKQFSINLPATCIFVYRTVEKLAAHILFCCGVEEGNGEMIQEYFLTEYTY